MASDQHIPCEPEEVYVDVDIESTKSDGQSVEVMDSMGTSTNLPVEKAHYRSCRCGDWRWWFLLVVLGTTAIVIYILLSRLKGGMSAGSTTARVTTDGYQTTTTWQHITTRVISAGPTTATTTEGQQLTTKARQPLIRKEILAWPTTATVTTEGQHLTTAWQPMLTKEMSTGPTTATVTTEGQQSTTTWQAMTTKGMSAGPTTARASTEKQALTTWQTMTTAAFEDCQYALSLGNNISGVYEVSPDGGAPFNVYCDMEYDGGGWTLFQRRFIGDVDFFLDWEKYRRGFGNLTKDHWLGNDNIHRLTARRNQTLLIILQNKNGGIANASYRHFDIAGEADKYRLSISNFQGGNAGDSLPAHQYNNNSFSTHDADNDGDTSLDHANYYHGGWWYKQNVYSSNLNGWWGHTNNEAIFWVTWAKGGYSLTSTTMMVRGRA